jgi:YVTN family beta-propeller protein
MVVLLWTIPVFGSGDFISSPFGVAVTPNDKKVYVANGSRVSVILTATDTVVAQMPVNSTISAIGVAVTPDGARSMSLRYAIWPRHRVLALQCS